MHEKIFLFIKKYFLRREKENNGQKKRIFQFIVNLKKQMLQIFLVVTKYNPKTDRSHFEQGSKMYVKKSIYKKIYKKLFKNCFNL